ncbi:MAG: undecaprenyl-phosphate glucose phosphotransferase [Hyphomicrobiaceae bacterium]|nr:undecaprenyl-phosphate glucose phosphotransferase [Hyphomicrobiaceae bacterium]
MSCSDSVQIAKEVADAGKPAGNASIRPRLSRVVALDIVALLDVLAIGTGAFVPAAIYASFGEVIVGWIPLTQAALFSGFVAHLMLRNAGYYDTSKIHDLPQAPMRMLLLAMVSIGSVIGLGLPIERMQWHVLVWYALWLSFSFTILLATRGIAHATLARFTAAGRFERRVAVFGAGAIARRVRNELADPRTGIHFAGVYDDRAGTDRIDAAELEVRGRLSDLLAAADAQAIDDIVIALPQGADGRISSIVRYLEKAPCNVHIVTHIASDIVACDRAHRVSNIGCVGLIDVKDKALSDWAPIVKRAEDIVVAGVLLVVALPILALAIAAIKLESDGPAFYRQRRRGLNRRVFDVLKLRTLKVSEADGEVRQVTPDDDRVTRVGRILRRTSIDELPQLWNVLKGDMSIVGPRPHALVHDEQFSTMLEEYANRHQVKPGITGLAQVNGFRGETRTIEQIKGRVEQDIAYVRSWSLGLDLSIIARTFSIVFSGKNAN